MNRLLASLLMIGIVTGMAGAGTWAYFTDTETSEGNTFMAGTLDLTVDGGEYPDVGVKVTLEDMAPGDENVVDPIVLENIGSIDGIADLHYTITNDPIGLANKIIVDVWYDANRNGIQESNELIIEYADSMTLAALHSEPIDLGPLPATGNADLYLSFHFNEDAGNEYQDATCTFDIEFTLHQPPGPE